jgi:hypothetical protein
VQEKMGRATLNRADFNRLRDLADFILSECCSDQQREAANDG